MEQSTDRLDDHYPISVVVRRTGLTQDILRAWERRYEAVVPFRTPTGRRLYSEDQVAKLRVLKILIDGGRRISDVANLGLEDLQAMAAQDATEAVVPAPAMLPREVGGFLATCVDAVDRLDRHDLEGALDAALVALSRPRLRDEVIAPLITELGRRWREGTWRVVNEHMATAVLRAFLWSMWRRTDVGPGAPAVVVATPAGQRHELGALMAAGVAADLGRRVVYLGTDLPAEEIAAAMAQSGATTVLLSLVYPTGDARQVDEIRRLRRLCGPDAMLVAGGRGAAEVREELAVSGVRVVDALSDLEGVLDAFER